MKLIKLNIKDKKYQLQEENILLKFQKYQYFKFKELNIIIKIILQIKIIQYLILKKVFILMSFQNKTNKLLNKWK